MDPNSTGIGLDPLGLGRKCSRPIRVGLGWLGWLGRDPAGLDRPRSWRPLRRRGQYNEQTAVARSINEDTWQRWNQYLYLSNEEATRKYLAKKNFDIQNNKNAYNSIIKRLQDNPTAKDVDDGDALERGARPA